MRRARSLLASVLVGALLFSAFAAMGEEACVQGYRKANAMYFTELENIRKIQKYADAGVWVGAGTGVACLIKRRSLSGVLLCGLIGSVIAVPSYYVSEIQQAQIDQMNSTYQLEDYYLTYQAYFAYKSGLHGVSEDAKTLVGAVGVDPEQGDAVLENLKSLMETGVLCEGGSTPRTSYKAAVELIRGRM